MTVAVVMAGLLPIMIGTGTGSEVMQRIAAPMVGGMVTAPLLSMFVIPAAFLLLRRRELRSSSRTRGSNEKVYPRVDADPINPQLKGEAK
jgi:Cu(I)/Ag(I) efflux system membrane protein CusA/SilA